MKSDGQCERKHVEQKLKEEMLRIKKKLPMLSPLEVKLMPVEEGFINGKQLEEQVKGNEIHIYTEDLDRAIMLLAHGCSEWLLNQHSKPFRSLINRMIEVFEDLQYQQKEQIADALADLLLVP